MARQGLINRLVMGKDDKPDFTPDKLPVTRWALFKDIFFTRFSALMGVNLLCVLFMLPTVAVTIIFIMQKSMDNAYLPYSANIGIGYEVVVNALALGELRNFQSNIYMFTLLIPCIMIAFVGFSGAFYVFRKLVWNENLQTLKDFFRGIKRNWGNFLLAGFIAGLTALLVVFNLGVYDIYRLGLGWKITGLVATFAMMVLVLMLLMFFTTQSVAYNMKLKTVMRNSFIFTLGMIPPNLIFIALSAIPVVLMLIPGLFVVAVMIVAMLGFSYIFLVWTVYAHYCYDRFLNDKIEGMQKDRGFYKPKTTDEAQDAAPKKAVVAYKNPKKKRKRVVSIDEGKSITPLSSTFSRADLERLEKEREEIEREYKELRRAKKVPKQNADGSSGQAAAQESAQADGEAAEEKGDVCAEQGEV